MVRFALETVRQDSCTSALRLIDSKGSTKLISKEKLMKNITLAAITMLFAIAAPLAQANTTDTPDNPANFSFVVEDGVAVISGTAEDKVEKKVIENIILRISDADEVRNELTIVKTKPELDSNIGATGSL